MLYENAQEARTYFESGTYNWAYDLSDMVEEYSDIEGFPDMRGTLRDGRKILGTYEANYDTLDETAKANVDSEYEREQIKAHSSYEVTAEFD